MQNWVQNWAKFWDNLGTAGLQVWTCIKAPNMSWARFWAKFWNEKLSVELPPRNAPRDGSGVRAGIASRRITGATGAREAATMDRMRKIVASRV